MNKEDRQILIDGYWLRISKLLSNPSNKYKYDNAKKIKELLQEIIGYLDKIIELESENEN